jgi:leader peptidase (prepilin peptidase)/N-methyltransferase
MPEPLIFALVAAVGLAVGSFLNVCIYRLPRHESLLLPASHCPACGRALTWYENIPVLSWVALRGRCRTCGTRISVMYPLVELAAGAIAVAWYVHFGLSFLFASRLVFALALLVLFVIDLQERILPNMITVPGAIVGLALSFFGPPEQPGWRDSFIGLLAGGGGLWLLAEVWLRVRHEEGMGLGDVKMLAMIGAFLGWKVMFLTVMLSSVLGSVVGFAIIAARIGDRKYQLPFGTFLALVALVMCLAGEPAWSWYVGRFFYR